MYDYPTPLHRVLTKFSVIIFVRAYLQVQIRFYSRLHSTPEEYIRTIHYKPGTIAHSVTTLGRFQAEILPPSHLPHSFRLSEPMISGLFLTTYIL